MNVYRNIDRQAIQFDFAVRSGRREYYDAEIENLGGRIFHLPWRHGNPFSVYAYTRRFKQLLVQNGPFTALHSHVGANNGYIMSLGRQAGIPVRVAHSHSSLAEKRSLLRDIWSDVMRRAIHKNATHLLACSEAAAAWLFGTAALGDSRFSLVPNAIDLTKYRRTIEDREFVRRELGLPTEGILLGHIGRFEEVKNHDFLLQIYSEFSELCSPSHLILVGEGSLEREIRGRVEQLGLGSSVLFLGPRSDVPQIMQAMDLLLLPSLYEGLGMVLIEAQAAGVPSLASDVVPEEADIKLGLVERKSLAEAPRRWAHTCTQLLSYQAPPFPERMAALSKAGYDVRSLVNTLATIYLSYA